MDIWTFATEKEWLEARRKHVTSTEVSALFGKNPRLTAFELACIKKDPKLDQFDGNERTEWGQALQDAIGAKVAHKYNVGISPLALQLATDGACAASADFLLDSYHGDVDQSPLAQYLQRLSLGILEIKNVDSLVFKNEWTEYDMPDHIELQLQAELLCWDVKWGAVAALVGGNRLELYIRERDPRVCELMKVKATAFMLNLARGIMPSPTMPEDANMVIALHQYADPNRVLDWSASQGLSGASLLDAVVAYKNKKKLADTAEEEAKVYKARILELIGDAERVINIPGFNLSASMRADVKITEHVRKGYRDLRITERKPKSGKDKTSD